MTRALLLLERLRNSFWVLPALGITLAIVAALLIPQLDESLELPDAIAFSGSRETARVVLQVIATVAVSVAGISFSVIVVALVLASQQLSPRVLRNFQRRPLNQAILGLFLSTATYSLFVLAGLEADSNAAPEVAVTIAMLLAVVSLALFVVFLHHLVRSLNASAVIRRIAADGHQAIREPYPAAVGDEPADDEAAVEAVQALVKTSARRSVRSPRAGYLASVDAAGLLHAADECDGFVEQRRTIGEFAVTGSLLAEVWCPADRLDVLCTRVESSFVLDEERGVDDDVAFPLRQLVDVAMKGLSPGINDPTTADGATRPWFAVRLLRFSPICARLAATVPPQAGRSSGRRPRSATTPPRLRRSPPMPHSSPRSTPASMVEARTKSRPHAARDENP